MKTVLNAGSGAHEKLPQIFKGWRELRLDIDPATNPDVVGDITNMNGVDDNSVDAVYCSHTLEHLDYWDVINALGEFGRVLKSTGFVLIETPNLQAVAQEIARGNLTDELYLSPTGPIAAIDIVYGHRSSIQAGQEAMRHKTGFTAHTLKERLEYAFFERVEVIEDGYNLLAAGYMPGCTEILSLPKPEQRPEVDQIMTEIQQDFEAIAMPRTPFMLDKFVVSNHEHPAQQWAHCVLEMKIKYNALRRAKITRKRLQVEIDELLATGKEIDGLEAELKQIDLEEQDNAALGAIRELEALYQIYQRFGRRYSRDELNDFQAEYWRNRITNQANRDLLATGHISQSNQEALGNIGLSAPGQNQQIATTQQNYLSQGNRRILIITPTEHKAIDGLPVLDRLIIPGTMETKIHNIYGLPTDKAYNEAVLMALREGCDYLLTVEDDTYPPPDGLVRLLQHRLDIVGGWYPMRHEPIEGVPIVLTGDERKSLMPDGNIHEVYTIPQGFTLFRVDIFRQINHPWFVTTPQLSQDSYFSQQARGVGYRLWCDTSILCEHKDRESGKVYKWTPET